MKFPISKIKTLGDFLIYSDITFIAVIMFFFAVTFYNYNEMVKFHIKKDQMNMMEKIKELVNDELYDKTNLFQLLNKQDKNSFKDTPFISSVFESAYYTDKYFKITNVILPVEATYLNNIDMSQTDIVRYRNFKKINDVYIIPSETSIISGKYAITLLIDNYNNRFISELKFDRIFNCIKKSLHYDEDIIMLVKKKTSQIIASSDNTNYPYWEISTSGDMVKLETGTYTFSREPIDYLGMELIMLSKVNNYFQYIYLSKNYLIVLIVLILLSGIFRSIVMNKYNYKPIKKLLSAINKNRTEKIELDSSFDEWIQLEKEYNNFIDKINDSTTKLITEINERIKIQDSLSYTKKYLDTIFNTLPSIIIGIDSERNIVHWNNAADKEFQLAENKVKNKKIEAVIPFFKFYLNTIIDSMGQKKTIHLPKECFVTETFTSYKDVLISPFDTETNQGVLIKIDDITEKVNYQDFLIQTEKLINIGGVASGLSNEINNPLSGIIQAVQNIKRRLVPGFKKNEITAAKYNIDLVQLDKYANDLNINKALDDMRNAALKTSGLLKEMLDMSKTGGSTKTPIEINTLIENALYIFLNDNNIRNNDFFGSINILKEFDESNPIVEVVQNEIEIVIFNLLKNAVYSIASKSYSENTTPYIKISYGTEENSISLNIEDNGEGYDEIEKKRVFSPFQKKDARRNTLDMGLSISYFIITEKHFGVIDLESQKGIGSIFTIRLPLKPA